VRGPQTGDRIRVSLARGIRADENEAGIAVPFGTEGTIREISAGRVIIDIQLVNLGFHGWEKLILPLLSFGLWTESAGPSC
jgi:hypothetical protein